MSSSHWVSSAQSNNSQAFGGCTSFSSFKSVCQSQNRKCVCQSQNSHIESPSEAGGRTMVCDGPNWCLADCMLRNYYKTLSKTAKTCVIEYFVTDRYFYK